MGDLSHGNVNLFILFLVVAALYALRHGRDWLSGCSLALAIACKLTPALFIPYLVWKRAWRALAGCLVGLVLFLLIVPAVRLGNARNLEDLKSWTEQMIAPYLLKGNVTSELANQSLPGVVYRLATHSPSVMDFKGPAQYENLLDLDPRWAGWIIKGCMALFVALVLCCCRTPLEPRTNPRLAAEFSLILLGMLLFSERTWKHHAVTLALPFAVLCYELAVRRHGPLMQAYLLGTLVLALLCMTSTSTLGVSEAIDEFARKMQVYGAYVWAYMLLTAALVVRLLRRPGPSATVSRPREDSSYSALGSRPIAVVEMSDVQ
jgi:hypothetical protein